MQMHTPPAAVPPCVTLCDVKDPLPTPASSTPPAPHSWCRTLVHAPDDVTADDVTADGLASPCTGLEEAGCGSASEEAGCARSWASRDELAACCAAGPLFLVAHEPSL